MKAKIIPLKNNHEDSGKMDLETCKRLININGNKYTDAEILKIRDFLYQLAEIECRYFKQWQTEQHKNVKHINSIKDERKESVPIYPSEHRRTG